MKTGAGKFLLRGTFGQTAVLVSAAILVAQLIGFLVPFNEQDRWRLIEAVQPAVERFAETAHEVTLAPPAKRTGVAFRDSHFDQHFMVSPQSMIALFGLTREQSLEEKLKSALVKAGVAVKAIQASSIGFTNSPQNRNRFHRPPFPPFGLFPEAGPLGPPSPSSERNPFDRDPPNFPPDARHRFGPPPDGNQEIDLAVQLSDGSWLNAQFMSMRPPPYFFWRLIVSEVVLFALVLTVTLFLVARLTRPLAQLARASEHIGPNEPVDLVPETGPSDVRAAIQSFNAMARRVADLLREKDRMLGAIGHDLRTPLASLRLRAESIEPESEREKIVETLDDMTKMVDEILNLIRLGRPGEQFALVDMSALADSVVEEFRELGRNVTFFDSPRAVLFIQPSLVKRLVRNLIENGVKFGDCVHVAVEQRDGETGLSVCDNGPGIPPEALERVFEPFTRLESSRSRETGGVGLGLSIAQTIAKSQGAVLSLSNREDGGLSARVTWQR